MLIHWQIAVLPITSTWAMLATQVMVIITTPFKWGRLIQSKIQLKILRQVAPRGGTFTQKALRDAGDMLATPNGHKKVIVLLTDGVPTFSYKVSRVQTEADDRFTGHNLRIDKINQVALLYLW